MPFCTQCGSRNPDTARFCAQCGSRIVAASPAGAPEAASAPDAPATTATPAPAVSETPAADAPATDPGAGEADPLSGSDVTATVTFGVPVRETEEHANLAPDDAAAVDGLPQGSALLVVQRGPGAGNRFLLDQDVVTAGRHPESEIFLDDITVSRRHVEFRRAEDTYTVHDVGSLNGTYVNRDRIDESSLQNGDEVQIGKFRLVYFTGDSAGH